MSPEEIQELVAELRKLNENLKGMREFSQDARRLASALKTLNAHFRHLGPLSRQINILNQIMMQVRQSEGVEGMMRHLMDSFFRMVR